MDKSKIKQIANRIDKSLSEWDFNKAMKFSNDETKTRDYLVEPFFKILGYKEMDDYTHEYSLRESKGKVKKVDMVIFIDRREPTILVECKKANTNLNERNFNQLASYYHFHKESKLGILTNGIVYKFYSRNLDDKGELNPTPFATFDLNDYDMNDVEELVRFYRLSINVKEIMEEASEIYFLERFDEGLLRTLYKPNEDFIKLVYRNMGGKRITDRIRDKIFNLINSISLNNTVDRIKVEESKDSKSGIVTTAEELKCFSIVKTIIAMSSKIKNTDLDRVGYRDYKGFFNIIVDDKARNTICYFKLNDNKKLMGIEAEEYDIGNVSVKSITKFRRHLTDSALSSLTN
tara:strand:- start:73 stop:1113 length:1041 start_codon:yes stop_codon:yes gene_type:complete